jgi:hypothetical protein
MIKPDEVLEHQALAQPAFDLSDPVVFDLLYVPNAVEDPFVYLSYVVLYVKASRSCWNKRVFLVMFIVDIYDL